MLSHNHNKYDLNHTTDWDHSSPRVMPYFVASSLQHIQDSFDHLPVFTFESQASNVEGENANGRNFKVRNAEG